MSFVSLANNNALAKQFLSRSFQFPLRQLFSDKLNGNKFSKLFQVPNKRSIKVHNANKNLSQICRSIVARLSKLPLSNHLKRCSILQKRSVILISAGSFLGYHKDGKRQRLFQPDTDSLAQRKQDAAKVADINRIVQRKTLLGRILSIYIRMTEIIFVVLRTIQLTLYFLPLVLSAPFAWFNRWFRVKVWYEMLVMILEQCGPIFVKMGQWASTRRDIFSDDVCEALTKLQRYARSHPWSHTLKTLEASLGPLWYFKFEDFDTKPIGSGACAQVYTAKVNLSKVQKNEKVNMSEEPEILPVAVKILHPNIVCKFERDLGVFQFLVDMAYTFMPSIEWISFRESLDEFAFQMQVQLDLTTEAENMLQFGNDYQNGDIIFPKPIIELCTPELLVQTFEHGVHIQNYLSDLGSISKAARKKMSDLGADLLLSMVFKNNFVHGDLHPGNILVRGSLDKPSQLKLVILDSGMVATLSPNDFRNLHDTFEAVIKGNGREVGQLFLERSPMSHCKNPEKFISAMAEIVEIAQKDRITFDNTEVAKLLLKVFDTLQTNRVKLDANFAAVILSIMVIEGMARQLDPEIDLIIKATPYVLKSYLMRQKLAKRRLKYSKEGVKNIIDEQLTILT